MDAHGHQAGSGQVHAALMGALGDGADWERLQEAIACDVVPPGTVVRAAGAPTSEVLVVDTGVFEVEVAGEPPRWATPGAIIGVAESILGIASPSTVTAIRHARVARVPAEAFREVGLGATRAYAIAQLQGLSQSQGEPLLTLPPDPLVIAIVVEDLPAEREGAIFALVEQAVASMEGSRLVRIDADAGNGSLPLVDELALHEAGGRTMVYFVAGDAGVRGGAVAAHADRILLIQPPYTKDDMSPARRIACDGAPRRHTDVVYVESGVQQGHESTRQMRAPAHVKRMHILPEPSATRLELLLTELRQGAREHETLRDFELFAGMTAQELAWVQRELRWQRVDGGSVLVRQGDAGDALWLLRAGRLSVLRESNGTEAVLAALGPGAVVGEAALLAGTAHTETVRALRDSTVARLDRAMANALLERSPGFARSIARVVAREYTTRSFGETGPNVHTGRTIAVIPLSDPARVARFVESLAMAMTREGASTTVVDTRRLEQSLGSHAPRTRRGDVGDVEIIAWLDRLERTHETVVLVCGGEVDSWMRRAVRQCDVLVFVADAGDAPTLRPTETAIASGKSGDPSATMFNGERHLVLLQPAAIAEAKGTPAWLAERREHKHHHVRAESADDLARVARRLTGRAVALALSGAASRAPAHFGVVRAMRDQGLPIDIMSGSSSGAGVAALVALGFPFEEALRHALTIIRNGIPTLRQFQPPITALTSGKEAGDVLRAVYGDRMLEDQILPVLITASDIRRHRLVLLTRGPIWKLVRASGSLPLLWPPVWHDDDLLVDGAILNYLPVDLFGWEAEQGLVIGSNLEVSSSPGAVAFEKSLRYGTHISGWRVMLRRLLGAKSLRPPKIVEILYHAMAIPSFQQQERLIHLAARDNTLILTPPLKSFGLFGANAEIGKELERQTWEHARAGLEPLAAKWRAQREPATS